MGLKKHVRRSFSQRSHELNRNWHSAEFPAAQKIDPDKILIGLKF